MDVAIARMMKDLAEAEANLRYRGPMVNELV